MTDPASTLRASLAVMTPAEQDAALGREIRLFKRACRMLADLAATGLEIYVDGSGHINLMRGPSHDETARARALRDNVIMSCHVPGASGGDW